MSSRQCFTAWAEKALPALSDSAVHVWRVCLEDGVNDQLQFESLSSDELRRAKAFHFDKDRRHYACCRSALRKLLSNYVGRRPSELTFDYNEFGKPSLSDKGLQFNVSHSGGWALIAVSKNRSVGVDIELIRPLENIDRLASDCFSHRELQAYRALSEEDKLPGFFNGWTRKEAFIKACGRGLSQPLQDFDVTLTPGQPACLESIEGDHIAAGAWSLHSLAPERGFAGAVVVESPRVEVLCWEFNSAADTGE